MSLSSISIKRPVLAMVMSMAIVLFGLISLQFLGVREYPSVDNPIITVSTSYPGANAEVIESQITEPLEESINGIAGIRSLISTSRDGRSSITVEFNIDIDLEAAANDVRDRVSRAVNQLPADADPPQVAKADADATPIIFMSLQSDTRGLLEISALANNLFKERFQTIDGVSRVQIWGEKKYSMRLWMDPAKLAGYGITPMEVRDALRKENIELPSGRIEGFNTELTVRTLGRLTTAEEFNDLIIKETATNLIRFRDIGRAEIYPENDKSILKRDGIPMVGVVLIPQPGSNHISIANSFYERFEQLKKELPADITASVGFDTTEYIKESITEVEQTIYVAFALVIIIIFLFLRDWRTTLIPIIAIPISLIGTFFIMYIFNFSVNVLTLLGIVLAIGIVVDDAIVVLENIYKKVEDGLPPVDAAIQGSKEIFFAVLATTVALVSVFLPIIFLQGLTGRLFKEFGIVIAGSVLISSFVALTLTSMLSSRLLKSGGVKNKFYLKTEPFFEWLTQTYSRSLQAFLRRRWLAFPVTLIMFVAIYFFGGGLKSELSPVEDRGAMRLLSTAPEGSSYEFMEHYMNTLVALVQEKVPENRSIISVTSPGFGASSTTNSGFVRLILKSAEERQRTQTQIARQLTSEVKALSDARTVVIEEQSIGGGGRGGLPVQFVVQAGSLEKLKTVIPKFLAEVRKDSTFAQSDVNLKFTKPELVIEINREKARELGVSVLDIAQTLQLAYSGQRFGYYVMDGKQYQVIGQVMRENRNKPADIKSLYVLNGKKELVQLDNLVTITENSNPPQIFRFNRLASATFSAGLAPGKTIGEGIEAMEAIAERVLDDTYNTSLDGASKDFRESSSSLMFTFVFALVLMYLVLAAQFESFRDPLIVMFTVPLAIAGAVISLWYFNQTMNIFSQIGQIMLIGLVTKNGILIVEFANQKKSLGMSAIEAVSEAAKLRMRPILMTSLSTILGILPIALALGAGSESRVSMGIAVVGGLILSTFLTLFLVPAVYTYFTSKKRSISESLFASEAKEDEA